MWDESGVVRGWGRGVDLRSYDKSKSEEKGEKEKRKKRSRR